MKTKVLVSSQVECFVKSLAPEPRRLLIRAIKGLALDKGDRKLLEGKLSGYQRLRVSGMRVVYKEISQAGVRQIVCIYVNYRSVVYEMFTQLLADQLLD
ncbi:MAG: hypothetical protein WCO56_13640 [Verrucomicrobiota bacterium]